MVNDGTADGKRAVVGIEKFAHQKGVAKGLHQFRERKEKKRLETAKSLRTYKKAMKKEGYEPGTGASRKRKDENNGQNAVGDSNETVATTDNHDEEDTHPTNSAKPAAKQHKNHGSEFYTASQQSNKRVRRIEEREAQMHARERDRKQALRKRRQRHERLSARTKKGQPVMKNIVHDILDKLQREKEENALK